MLFLILSCAVYVRFCYQLYFHSTSGFGLKLALSIVSKRPRASRGRDGWTSVVHRLNFLALVGSSMAPMPDDECFPDQS